MREHDIPLAFPCGRDFASMTRAEGGRLCAECQTIVRDLSSMRQEEARALLDGAEGARLCVRYLYDASGRVVFAGEEDVSRAKIVPAFRLTQRAKARIARAALLAAPLVLFEACGGAPGDPPAQNWQQQQPQQQQPQPPPPVLANPVVDDAGDGGPGDDGGTSGEAASPEEGGTQADAGPDAGPDAAPDAASDGALAD
jgi:hypothetical protein